MDPDGRCVGFIRSLERGSGWSQVEFFVNSEIADRKQIALALLSSFDDGSIFSVGHRLRFDINQQDKDLNEAIDEFGFSQKKQLFLTYELCLENFKTEGHLTICSRPLITSEVVEVLSHLHTVTEAEASKWIEEGNLRTAFIGNELASVAQIYEYGSTIEINRLATHAKAKRKGCATSLLKQIF